MTARRMLWSAAAALLVGAAAAGCGTTSTTMMGTTTSSAHRTGVPSFGSGRSMPPWIDSSCSPPSPLPGRTVVVMLGDMGTWGSMPMGMGGVSPADGRMMLHTWPARVPAGQVRLVAVNMGRRTHELVVLPLGADEAAGRRIPDSTGRVDETGALGEASASCRAGSGEGIRPGAEGWVTLTLARGRYELVCNLPGHYAAGMRQLLVVR